MKSLDIISYRLFGKLVKKYSKNFPNLETSLKKSNYNYTLEEWLSMSLFVSILGFFGGLIVSFFLATIFSKNTLLYVPFTLMGGLIIGLSSGFITYKYPLQIIASKKKKIENSLHFAAIYMSTLAQTGMPPYKIFEVLQKFREFGEIRIIAQNITRDMEVFGLDFLEALSRNAEKAPTKELQDLLYGMRSSIETGGDLKVFLSSRSKALTASYKRKLESYVKTLSLFLEIYITVVIVGSVFIIVLTTIMSILGGDAEQIKLIQLLLLTIALPALSAIFVIMLKTMSPTEV